LVAEGEGGRTEGRDPFMAGSETAGRREAALATAAWSAAVASGLLWAGG
jgi:hypothetical protein